MPWQMPAMQDFGDSIDGIADPKSGAPRPVVVLLCAVVLTLAAAGCGYTVLEHPDQKSPQGGTGGGQTTEDFGPPGEEPALPPGHPPIPEPVDWVGRSFLDELVGEAEPLRFENIRGNRGILIPSEHALFTLRVTIGGPAATDIWQIRMDEFGWVTASRWVQGDAGPQLDENLASESVEFRLDRTSESALRAMMIGLLPLSLPRTRNIPQVQMRDIPLEFWPYDDPGLIELDYRIERLDTIAPEDWPGGRIAAPLDLIQVLIGTWDSPPPKGIEEMVWNTADSYPLLIDLALLVEGVVLAWEIEGPGGEEIDLPLRVGR